MNHTDLAIFTCGDDIVVRLLDGSEIVLRISECRELEDALSTMRHQADEFASWSDPGRYERAEFSIGSKTNYVRRKVDRL